MILTNDQIVASLVAYYKQNGIDMSFLLGDPSFQALKLAEKVEAIKTHAADIAAGISTKTLPSERKSIFTNMIASAWPAIPAALAYGATYKPKMGVTRAALGRHLLVTGAVAAAGGAAFGGVQAYLSLADAKNKRQRLLNHMQHVQATGSTQSALGALSAGHLAPLSSSALGNLVSHIDYKEKQLEGLKKGVDTGLVSQRAARLKELRLRIAENELARMKNSL